MTFEEVMMSKNHGWRRDVAITDKLTATSTGSSVIVRWGQRGRVGAPAVQPRAQFAVSQLAPWVDLAAVTGLSAPLQMRPGESWTANLALPAPLAAMARAQGASELRLTTEQERLLIRRALTRQVIGISGPGVSHWTPNERVLKRAER
jgi:hypothetical protein